MINYQSINTAKDHRGAAQGAVNAAREQLAARRQELEKQRAEFNRFQDQKSRATADLKVLSESLARLQARQATVANITKQMRKVIMHLKSFMSKTSILYDELKDLISFELLIEPLNAILTELISNGVTSSTIAGATQISSTEINLTTSALDIIKVQLPTLPLTLNNSNVC